MNSRLKPKFKNNFKNYVVHRHSFTVVRESNAQPLLLDFPQKVHDLAIDIIPDDAREHFEAFYTDAQHQLIFTYEISLGTLTAALVHPRDIFGPAMRSLGIAAIILVHNHPSGDPSPSHEDIRLTRQLVDIGREHDIPIKDHVIVGSGTGRYVSLKERGIV